MRRRTRILTTLLLLVGLAALTAPAAHAASAFEQVLSDYQKDGKIDPCAHSEDTLRDAAGQIPNDIEQYAPDFPTALQDAIDARTQGKCAGQSGGDNGSNNNGAGSGGGSGSGGSGGGTTPGTATPPPATTTPPANTTPTPPSTTPSPATPQTSTTPAPPNVPKPTASGKPTSANTGDSSSDPPVPFILIAIVAGLILLTLAFFGTTRWLGWDYHHLAGVRQSWGEAGYRAGGTWADFRDWLRNGR